MVRSRKAAAKALGISERQLGSWKQHESFPSCAAGYDLDAIRAWRAERPRKKARQPNTAKLNEILLAIQQLSDQLASIKELVQR